MHSSPNNVPLSFRLYLRMSFFPSLAFFMFNYLPWTPPICLPASFGLVIPSWFSWCRSSFKYLLFFFFMIYYTCLIIPFLRLGRQCHHHCRPFFIPLYLDPLDLFSISRFYITQNHLNCFFRFSGRTCNESLITLQRRKPTLNIGCRVTE